MMPSIVLAKHLNSLTPTYILQRHASATERARKIQQFVPLLDGRTSRTGKKREKLERMPVYDYSKSSTNS